MTSKTSLTLCLMAAGITLMSPIAEARGGGRGAARTVGRQGTASTPRGTGSWQGTTTTNRQPGSFQSQYQGTRTGPQGQTSTVNRSNTVNRTGSNTYSRQTQQTVTGPNGQQRSWEAQGNGSIQKTDNGIQKTYEGTITNNKGNTVDVNRTTDVTKTGDGSVNKSTTSTYTNEQGKTMTVDRDATTTKNPDGTFTTERESTRTNGQGEVMGTGQSTTQYTPGQGTQTTGSYTNSQGKQWNYDGQSTRTEPGTVEHSQTVTNPAGQSRSSTGTARWQYVDGKWVRIYSGSTTPPTNTTTP